MRAALLGSGFDPLREILASSFRKGCAVLALTVTVAAVSPQARADEPMATPQMNPAVFTREVATPPDPAPPHQPESDLLSGVGGMALGTLVTLGIEIALCVTTGICALTMPP